MRLAALVAFLAVPAVAQEPTAQPSTAPVFSEQQKKDARAALEQVGKALGVETPPPTAAGSPAASPQATTLAGVADKALDLTTTAVTKISGMLEQVAPRVWRIFVVQQYSKAVSGLVVPWGSVLLCFAYMRAISKYWQLSEADQNKDLFGETDPLTIHGTHLLLTRFVPYSVATVFAFFGLWAIQEGIMMAMNPEYYAVKDLIRVLLSPASMQ